MRDRVVYLAAHGGFGGAAVPLGGGAAVFNLLRAEWLRTKPFEWTEVTPAVLGPRAPAARDIVGFSERQYARFCDDFREASTRAALEADPARTAVLANDISEGPDFARLHAAGFRVVTVYHVDVVDYIASIYLHGRLRPRRLVRAWAGLERLGAARLAPRILRLIFAQQRASLEWSDAVVVPSAGMKATLVECYPSIPPERIHVLGWGAPPSPVPAREAESAAAALRAEYGVPAGAHVLLCLSRISPEKGQDTLLEALAEWERRPDYPHRPLWLFLCGEAAFMQGRAFEARLRALAGRLARTRVVWPGYVAGARKQGFFRLADLYVFPSRHESYGLTLMEALAAGLPAVALSHQGSRDILRPEFGALVDAPSPAAAREGLREAIARLLAMDDPPRQAMRAAAAAHAAANPFAVAAASLARILAG